MRHGLFAILLMGVSSLASGAEPVASDAGKGVTAATPSASEQSAPKPRLRFRGKGPVCLCSKGLSEKDIQNANRAAPEVKPAGNGAEPNAITEPQQPRTDK
jgi:hypothetical protein